MVKFHNHSGYSTVVLYCHPGRSIDCSVNFKLRRGLFVRPLHNFEVKILGLKILASILVADWSYCFTQVCDGELAYIRSRLEVLDSQFRSL